MKKVMLTRYGAVLYLVGCIFNVDAMFLYHSRDLSLPMQQQNYKEQNSFFKKTKEYLKRLFLTKSKKQRLSPYSFGQITNSRKKIEKHTIEQDAKSKLKDLLFINDLIENLNDSASSVEIDSFGRTRLHTSVILGKIKDVRDLLNGGSDCNAQDDRGFTPLHYACFKGDIEIAKVLLEKQASIHSFSLEGYTPIHVAIATGNIDFLKELLIKEKIPNLNDSAFCTPLSESGSNILHLAACSESRKMMEFVLTLCTDEDKLNMLMNSQDDDGYYPIHVTVMYCNADCVTLMIEKGAQKEVVDHVGRTPFYSACKRGDKDILECLIRKKFVSTKETYYGSTLLHILCESGSLESLNLLVDEEIINPEWYQVEDFYGDVPLHVAVEKGNKKFVEEILTHMELVDINIKDLFVAASCSCHNPFMIALTKGKVELAEFLYNKYPFLIERKNIDQTILHAAIFSNSLDCVLYALKLSGTSLLRVPDENYNYPIHGAIHCGNKKILEVLIKKLNENRISLDDQDSQGYSPFLLAVESGNLDAALMLADAGANLELVRFDEATRVHAAIQSGNEAMMSHVFDLPGSDDLFGRSDANGWNPLHVAVARNNKSLVKELINKYSIDVNSPTDEGWTPILIAFYNGRVDIAEYLCNVGADWHMKSYNGWSITHAACKSGSMASLEFLVKLTGNKPTFHERTNEGLLPLDIALESGNDMVIKKLVEEFELDGNATDKAGISSYQHCIRNGHTHIARYLKDKIKWEHVALDGSTLLHEACESGVTSMVKLALKNVPETLHKKSNCEGWTALHAAVNSKNLSCVQALLDNNGEFDINTRIRIGWTPLMFALANGAIAIVNYLESKGANWNVKNEDGTTPYHVVFASNSLDCIRLIEKKAAERPFIPSSLSNGTTVLHIASGMIPQESFTCVRYILDTKKIDCNTPDNNNCTPLLGSVARGKLNAVRYLIDEKANLRAKTKDGGYSLLHAACESGSVEMLRYLLELSRKKKLPIDEKTDENFTALHIAVEEGSYSCVRNLVESQNFLMDDVTQKGETPFLLAMRKGNLLIAKYLRKKGASAQKVDTYGVTCVHRACEAGSLEVLNYALSQYKDALDKFDSYDVETPLHYASYYGSLECVQKLIKLGAKPDAINKKGETPLHLACKQGHLAVIKHLIGEKPSLLRLKTSDDCSILDYVRDSKSEECIQYVEQEVEEFFEETDRVYKELKLVEKVIRSNSNNLYYDLKNVYVEIRKRLSETYVNPHLFSIPHIDITTYNKSIRYISKRLRNNEDPVLLLHMWSFITGIPVVGLKESREYYRDNKHVYKFVSGVKNGLVVPPVFRFYRDKIEVDIENQEPYIFDEETEVVKHYRERTMLFQELLGGQEKFSFRERPQIDLKLLNNELHLLSNNDEVVRNWISRFLRSVTRLHDGGTPRYSLGMVSLLRKTAIYFSSNDGGQTGLVVSPCTRAEVDYFGLIDGIFLQGKTDPEEMIDYYLGVEFLRKAALKRLDEHDTPTALYYPHYNMKSSLFDVSVLQGTTLEQYVENNIGKLAKIFMKSQRSRSNEDNREDVELIDALINPLIEVADKQQLTRTLTSQVLVDRIFEPEYSIEVPFCENDNPFILVDSDEEDECEDIKMIPINHIIEHLQCFDYRNIREIHLNGHRITDSGFEKLVDALADNIVPKLRILDVANNNLEKPLWNHALRAFLRRYYLVYLAIAGKRVSHESIKSIDENRNKVIWVGWFNIAKMREKNYLTDDQVRNHKDYYLKFGVN